MASGYTQCDCPSCFEVAIGNDTDKLVLCVLCVEAGCDGKGECQVEPSPEDEDD